MVEELSVRERIQYSRDVLHARQDPVWFMQEILGWKSMWPKQEEIVRSFYQHKFNPILKEIKELAWISGQRCLSGYSLILTKENGYITISEVYNRFHSGEVINVKNLNGWVKIGNAFYTGFKRNYKLTTHDRSIKCSFDHKFYINDKWIPLHEIKSGDKITVYDNLHNKFYIDTVIGWDEEEYTVEMYDLHVPDGNCYIADGILTHNSGKSVTVAHFGAYEFFEIASLDNPAAHYGLMPNQPLAVSCIAAGKEQALDGIFSLMRNAMESSEWINQWWDLKYSEGRIDFQKKHIFAQIKAARADTGAGYTSKAVLFDELDLFQKNTESKISAENVFRKLVNSTMTLGVKGKIFSISSLDNVDGMMNKVYYDATQKSNALALKLKTWEVNPSPTVTEAALREEYKMNMDAFYKYFANQPEVSTGMLFPGPSDPYFNKSIPNLFDLNYIPPEHSGYYYTMAVDPAHRNDSFGISMGYRFGDDIIINGITKFTKNEGEEAYIKPSDIEKFVMYWMDNLNITTFIYDVDLVLSLVEKLEERGVTCIKHQADNEAYGRWVDANSNTTPYNVHITYNEFAHHEARQLMKVKTPTGKIRIDHPYSGSKDTVDTIANCIWHLASYEGGMIRTPVVRSIIR